MKGICFKEQSELEKKCASGRPRRDLNASFKGYFSLLGSVACLGFVCLDMLLHTVDKERGML